MMHVEQSKPNHIECLDGLRGIASLWVILGHIVLLSGFYIPVIAKADLGVDLFIVLSGFLMVLHYSERECQEPFELPSTWAKFWIRRYFRIAPAYYVALLFALLLGPYLFHQRLIVDQLTHHIPQLASRYKDHSATNVILHLTFAFGLIPEYAFRTPLPDWSIGLEMQFYLMFPFIMCAARKTGWLITSIVIMAICALIMAHFRSQVAAFPAPTFLPIKMHMFLSGMMVAAAFIHRRMAPIYLPLASVFAYVVFLDWAPLWEHDVRASIPLVFALLIFRNPHIPNLMIKMQNSVSNALSRGFFKFAGDVSYGVYLLHLFILIPVSAFLFRPHFSAPARFFLTVAIVIPPTYFIAWIMFRFVENPGRRAARFFLSTSRSKSRMVEEPVSSDAAVTHSLIGP